MARFGDVHQGILSAIFAACLVGVGTLQVAVYRLQAHLMSGQLKAATIAANAAKASADATIAAELPGFVADRIDIQRGIARYTITFRNYGRSPAILFDNYLVVKTISGEMPETPDYTGGSASSGTVDSLVVKDQGIALWWNANLEDSDWDHALKADVVAICAYGFFDYLDFMKKRRREGFCFVFVPKKHLLYDHPASGPPTNGVFMRGGPPAYTYNRLVESDAKTDDA